MRCWTVGGVGQGKSVRGMDWMEDGGQGLGGRG